ncbi:hypothetical protein EYF80_017472 [Liparis tanakae]|uniref:Uncharacterized protein n=1 Tax=Liparis tanakae TaxID=230148 RepID=A0A4Z2I3D1_9TELE|nr:hypothetical protein EYF80_017472 [Liparis tanakae]
MKLAAPSLLNTTQDPTHSNFVARKLPAARAPAANMMGTALVMPTNDWKMLMPRTAASLQRAFRKPNASSTVITSRAFHEAMLMPPNRHKRAIIPDSLLPNIRKKQLTQEMTLDPADQRQRNRKDVK